MNNYNNIKNNSIKESGLKIKRNGKKHAAVVAAKTVACVVLIAGSIYALHLVNSNKNQDKKNNQEKTHININKEQDVVDETPEVVELTDEEKIEKLYKEMLDYAEENKIDNLTYYYEEHYEEISCEEPDEEIMYLYASNAYKRAHDKGIDHKTLVKELDVMYQMQELPSCIDEETLYTYLGNLNSTIDENYESLFMIYNPLAILTHNETCEKEHVMNITGGISHKGEEPELEYGPVLTK